LRHGEEHSSRGGLAQFVRKAKREGKKAVNAAFFEALWQAARRSHEKHKQNQQPSHNETAIDNIEETAPVIALCGRLFCGR
jgi:hypothetical protein